MPELDGQATGPVIVTGASRGIGAATAMLAGERGYAVCVNYVARAEAAERVSDAILAAGGRAFTFQADCADECAVRTMFDAATARYGAVYGLVNNAGLLGQRTRLAGLETGDLRAILDTNVLGTIICAREAVRRMSRANGGRGGVIVNVSSVAARHGSPGTGVHYAASKGAVDAFTTGLAKEVIGEGIRVNAVSPGVTTTDMMPPEQAARAAAACAIGRPADPSEIANAILWLLSPASSYTVGANVLVAGGRM